MFLAGLLRGSGAFKDSFTGRSLNKRVDPCAAAGTGTMTIMTKRSAPITLMFADDGSIPNNPRLPFLVYRGAISK